MIRHYPSFTVATSLINFIKTKSFFVVNDLFANKQVRLLMAPNEVFGLCRGIDEQGAVVIETNSEIKAYIGGEISLRGI